MADTYTSCGKQIMRNGEHFADAKDVDAAARTVAAFNRLEPEPIAGYRDFATGFAMALGLNGESDLSENRSQTLAVCWAQHSGRPVVDEQELIDIVSDAMSDVHDVDTGITDFAKAGVKALKKEGLL